MNLKILKQWRIWLLLFCLVGSLILIAPSGKEAVIVKSVSPDSPLFGKLKAGDSLDWINEKTIKNPEDIHEFEDYTGVLRFMKNGQLELADVDTPGLGVVLIQKPSSRLNFGMDMIGGTRVLLKPIVEKNISSDIIPQTIATLETRINIYGLRESKIQPLSDIEGNKYVQIEMAGGTRQEIEDLLAKQGMFEGKILRVLDIENKTGKLLGMDVVKSEDAVKIGSKILKVNETAVLDNIQVKYMNTSEGKAVFFTTVFTGNDIKSVCMQEQAGICTSRILQQRTGWQFMFQVFVSQESAEKFAKVTKEMEVIVDPRSGETYLDGQIFLFLDEKLISSLNIAADLAGKAYTEPVITGFREVKEDALSEKLMLQSILQSGSLPVKLEIIKVDQISPTLGEEFLASAGLAGLLAALAVGIIVFIRYRKFGIALPVVLTSLSEVIIILGAASLVKWTIDLASIAGIIAAVGTGVDSQIMIIDEILAGGKRRMYTLKQKMKRAFFIIFSSASTTIAAMVPLMAIGIGVMRGFAITTTIGVLVGIFISRPAFGKIAEFILEKEVE